MERKPKILVATHPLLASSAIHAALSSDPRFETFLLPEDEDAGAFAAANEVDVMVVSARPTAPERPVVVLSDDPVKIEFFGPDGVLTKTYDGFAAFAELLWERIGPTNNRVRAGPSLRSPPTSPASGMAAEEGGP